MKPHGYAVFWATIFTGTMLALMAIAVDPLGLIVGPM